VAGIKVIQRSGNSISSRDQRSSPSARQLLKEWREWTGKATDGEQVGVKREETPVFPAFEHLFR
jgi:hypothetical protein